MPLTMDTIELARLEEMRQARGVSEIANESQPIAGGVMSYEAPDSWANQACGLGLTGPVSDADLDRLVEWYAERGAPARIELTAHADHTLIEGLRARGFLLHEFENVYALDLPPADQLRERAAAMLPEGAELIQLQPGDDDGVMAFVEVTSSGFPPRLQPDGSVTPVTDEIAAIMRKTVEHPRTRTFLAYMDGRVVATGACEVAPPIVCMFGAVTLPEYRRRGLQAALIAMRLAHARDAGCGIGVIHTRPGIATERNIRRLGAELAYTKVVMQAPRP